LRQHCQRIHTSSDDSSDRTEAHSSVADNAKEAVSVDDASTSLNLTDIAPEELIDRPLANCGHVELPNVPSIQLSKGADQSTIAQMSSKPRQATRGDIERNPIKGNISHNATHKALETKIDALQKRKEETIRKFDKDIEGLQSALRIFAEQ